jgi:DNA mismatch repair protein MutL
MLSISLLNIRENSEGKKMPKIKILDEDTVNKIAAGEVVERPASVVKELVENSIDAGATKILIEVLDGGRSLIRVTDDGSGMDGDDLILAFQQHATSKISRVGDLDRVTSLGFRGEALSSIASVARVVEVKTKPRTSDFAVSGSLLRMENGSVVEIKDFGCPLGTSVVVKDLFYNIPARLKYLGSASAELARISKMVTDLAIINYRISFELFTGKRTIFKSNRSESWDDVLLTVLGRDAARGIVPIYVESKRWTIRGVVGKHKVTRSSADSIFVYVNERPISSRRMIRAVRDAYKTLIPAGKYPVALISIDIDPSLVDVNVHPTKREIRFLREEAMADSLSEAVSEALYSGAEEISGRKPEAEIGQVSVDRDFQSALPLEMESLDGVALGVRSEELPHEGKVALRILGQLMNLYIVAEREDGLLLIDQHAAAERVRYEQLRDKHSTKKISQELIAPVTVELTPKEQVIFDSWKDILIETGFDIHHFGGNTYNVRAVPALGARLESPQAVHGLLRDLFALGKVGATSTVVDDAMKLMACRGSIKAGHKLSRNEMYDLVEALYACKNPKSCPHGRPTVVAISGGQLEKLFGRK